MFNLLLSASAPACGFISSGVSIGYGGTLASDWLQINVMLVMLIVMVSSLMYAISGIMPVQHREKLRGVVRYELFEAFLSVIIIFVIMLISNFACYSGASLAQANSQTNTYPGVFYSDELYIGNLVFNRGTVLASQIYTTAIEYAIAEQTAAYVSSQVTSFYSAMLKSSNPILIYPSIDAGELMSIFSIYSSVFSGTFTAVTLAVFSVLFILFLALPIIQAAALTVILPVAIFMRTLAFTGPKLREVSNTFLALAIGLFFVFPLTIAFNSYITNCISISGTTAPSSSCTWLNTKYLTVTPPPVSASSLFTSANVPINGASVSLNFFSAINSAGAAPGLSGILSLLIDAPTVAFNYTNIISEYAFEGVVLIALDLLITVGFIAGIAKGLNALSGIVSSGPFW
ncbi:MAG: hypothetical protein QXF85_01000 [Candidatus Micrarchaeaceae archaeon]